MAIYNGFSHEKWWCSIAMLVYQMVLPNFSNFPKFLPASWPRHPGDLPPAPPAQCRCPVPARSTAVAVASATGRRSTATRHPKPCHLAVNLEGIRDDFGCDLEEWLYDLYNSIVLYYMYNYIIYIYIYMFVVWECLGQFLWWGLWFGLDLGMISIEKTAVRTDFETLIFSMQGIKGALKKLLLLCVVE